MIDLKGFENYQLCQRTCEVYSKRKNGEYRPIQRNIDEKSHYFWLYSKGVRIKVLLMDILFDNRDSFKQSDEAKGKILNRFLTRSELT